MKIHIKNYRNIKNLELEIENNRLNFLYGICGTGKSSLVSALTKECNEMDVSVGKCIEDVVVNVDGVSPKKDDIEVFDENTVSNVIFKDSDDGKYYNIFIGNENEIVELEKKYNHGIQQLLEVADEIRLYKENIDKLFSLFGKPGNKGKMTAKSKINLLSKQIEASDSKHKAVIKEKGIDYVNWKIQGISIDENFANHKCPFCYQTIEDELYEEIEKFKSMVPKDFEIIFKGNDVLKSLNILEPDFYEPESLNEFKVEIEKHKLIQLDLEKLIQFCNFSKIDLFGDKQITKLEITDFTFEVFPSLKGIINNINSNIDELIVISKVMRGKAITLLRSKERVLNSILRTLGIPYEFKPTINRLQKTGNISLCHINDEEKRNMKNNLSYGEKNIIALMIFIFASNSEMLIIDDPASSYDDYRRKEIFDLLIKHLNGKTILLLSHDQIFLKYALLHKKRYINSNSIGDY